MRAPDFWGPSFRGSLLPTLLSPLGLAYALAGRWRWLRARPLRLSIPVICVGNLVAGGAGKTPVALDLAKRLVSQGCAVHLLTRGYGGSEPGPLQVDPSQHDAAAVGDEALLLAAIAPTWIGADRAASARAAVAAGAEVLVMDDGFQNSSLAKDLSLLVVDSAYGFGNGRLIPAGPLRETPARGLARADAVVIMGSDRLDLDTAGRPVLRARLVASSAKLAGRRVLAFAGLGRPEKFFDSLRGLGAELVETRPFADHHAYRADEIEAILRAAEASDAIAVTTTKDAVRLPPALRDRVETLPVEVHWDRADQLDALLAEGLGRV